MNKRQRKKAKKKEIQKFLARNCYYVANNDPTEIVYAEVNIITKPEDFQDLIQVEPREHFIMWDE